MTILTSRDHYPEPEREFELRVETVPARDVNAGDVISDGTVVHRSKNGTKWTELFDANEKRICRILSDTDVTVTRKHETEASREARLRWMLADRILDKYERNPMGELDNAVKHLDKRVADYGSVDYGDVGNLLTANARREVLGYFQHTCDARASQEDYEGDIVDVHDEFIEGLKVLMSSAYRNRGISRSSNQLSNLMEDVLEEARADFIHRSYIW